MDGTPTIWANHAVHYGDGTQASPYTVDSASKRISKQTTTYQYTDTEIYVKGTVVSVEYDSVANDWKIHFDGYSQSDALILKNYKFDSGVFSKEDIDY